MKLGPVVFVAVSDSKLTIRAPVDARRSVEIALPCEQGECPKLNPPLKACAPAFRVFEETVKMLRKLKGGESVKVRVRASNRTLTVEPPRRVFRVECSEPVEVKVYFGDLRQALSFFDVAGFNPSVLQFSESVLALEAEYGNLKLRTLIAGQPE